ncbi:nucleotidyl transferase AbiEii/AbiGii toxin family protein [Paraburkholderia sacchari]|uniref:Nucleotidyl transferase AbiEii/AbiGii toxin family protein n=1 Tax=Paraburkholderia sacchari TaxID=159450 RepID=A0A8T6ZM21_9BURK|nr:nucleotidyl transferase AbiEii/AbiGii toxin family protein [Paraburkholderia sacchari]NLP65533.1 nucleotidyl transferase AbiEii/AbiGii toxin family protein [Paraburkholderia sacchari]
MFNHRHHQNIIGILQKLDAELFERAGCYFGGGTAIVLATNEYRESVDIDFLIASPDGYRQIRGLVSDTDINKLAKQPIPLLRDVRKERDKISTIISAGEGERPIKLEFVLESRIPLTGQYIPGIPVPTLSRVDLYAEKLLANSDRWGDASVMYRDAIDLAMMLDQWGQIPQEAIDKTSRIYGPAALSDFRKVTDYLSSSEAALDKALASMAMDPELAPRITAVLQAEVQRIDGATQVRGAADFPDEIANELRARGLVAQKMNTDKGVYVGRILMVSGDYAVQDIGRNTVAVHRIDAAQAKPNPGERYKVQYFYGNADWEPTIRSGKNLGR